MLAANGVGRNDMTMDQAIQLAAIVTAGFGGWFALWQWHRDQRWKRISAAFDRIQAFNETPGTRNAMKILTCRCREVPLWDPQSPPAGGIYTYVSWDDAKAALLPTEYIAKASPTVSAIRDSFGDFLDRLTQIQMYLEAGLLKEEDVRHLVEPWGKRLDATVQDGGLARNIRVHLETENRAGVQALFRRFGIDLQSTLDRDWLGLRRDLGPHPGAETHPPARGA
jgi:hypothetical protein